MSCSRFRLVVLVNVPGFYIFIARMANENGVLSGYSQFFLKIMYIRTAGLKGAIIDQSLM